VDEVEQDQRAAEIVRQLMAIAIDMGASDIHLETLSDSMHIRLRVDGVLHELNVPSLQEACNQNARRIVSRIKILAKLDIAERRRPQDGSFRVRVDRKGSAVGVDLRVSVVPGYYGESVVLRILDRTRVPCSIDELGFSGVVTERLHQILKRSSGLFLITGPTGSGKSTTLYAALMTLYRPQIRIVTAEDPIEYVYEQFSQSEVNEQIGNTFATYLRAFLRHDPEVIMVGEIRDEDTAKMAFRAAQTGHLLLSTLHTNSAIGAIDRLLNLSVESNLVAASIIGVLAQRLVRQVCPACRAPYSPSPDLVREFFDTPPPGARWYRGQGCGECSFSGYKGRLCVSELWLPSQEDVILIAKNAPFEEIRQSAKRSTISMAYDVCDRLADGRTNLEELIRVLPYSSVYEFRQLQVTSPAVLAV
jgi:type II secretory ATPase GspE/PulE/Tfp pilus assembly ATPase PilB-like protein